MPDTIKKRLDTLDVDFQGTIFKSKTVNGWQVKSSSSGLKLSTMNIDYSVTWKTTSSPYGSYRCSIDIQESLPKEIYTSYPNINIICYSDNKNYSFLLLPIEAPSTTYVGKWQVIMLDKDASGTDKPAVIHCVITAIGF